MNIYIYMGVGIALFFGLGAFIYTAMFRNPTYLDKITLAKKR